MESKFLLELTCKKNKVGLVLLSWGQFQGIEISVWDANVLRLACPCIR